MQRMIFGRLKEVDFGSAIIRSVIGYKHKALASDGGSLISASCLYDFDGFVLVERLLSTTTCRLLDDYSSSAAA